MKFTLNYSQLPEAKDWEDGENYEVTLKQLSHTKNSAEFEIVNSGEEDEIEEEEDMEDEDEEYD